MKERRAKVHTAGWNYARVKQKARLQRIPVIVGELVRPTAPICSSMLRRICVSESLTLGIREIFATPRLPS
jgi:hypothetical protein